MHYNFYKVNKKSSTYKKIFYEHTKSQICSTPVQNMNGSDPKLNKITFYLSTFFFIQLTELRKYMFQILIHFVCPTGSAAALKSDMQIKIEIRNHCTVLYNQFGCKIWSDHVHSVHTVDSADSRTLHAIPLYKKQVLT